ncbi:hypothetical protein EMIHUDRAFT_220165 [Emiliania huxleyi CCMP1516]|uniref:TLDc domain-containing protein n=2 Tax=Emiliania huxleyi TaxID=2903 RepID=A0A0D3I1F6_EMIH1|nr:hypothetical protein EMIHUDRAFT_220165 [Emiliania huxleyi CCMP1516]EOD05091.1 hypothetical protein EMIHUDRAFT_220165 [Emiliania huxleyi CCMP1516]|eukprot:XP_005757520.1 hypothetical protein EMIHUDRAFT_220165 [Emiliania huxleyi CCMP1516]
MTLSTHQDLSAWDVSAITTYNMYRMFYYAASFSQKLCSDVWINTWSRVYYSHRQQVFSGTSGGNDITTAWDALPSSFRSNLYTVQGVATGTTHIVDGGHDMYDYGNYMSVSIGDSDYGSYLTYNQQCGSAPIDGDPVPYSTCMYPHASFTLMYTQVHATSTAPSNSVTGFRTTGNNGADGHGSKHGTGSTTPLTSASGRFQAHYTKVYSAGDPSINHLIVYSSSDQTASHSYSASTDSDVDTVTFGEPQHKVVYLLWAGTSGYNFPTSDFQSGCYPSEPPTNLCYSKSLHGASSYTFHSRCDNKGATLTLIQLSNGYKLAAYTSIPWTSRSGYGTGTSYIASITRNSCHQNRYSQYQIYDHNMYGPTFGGGHDIYINSNMNGGYCNYHSYYGAGSIICGSYSSWSITALEVYSTEA